MFVSNANSLNLPFASVCEQFRASRENVVDDRCEWQLIRSLLPPGVV